MSGHNKFSKIKHQKAKTDAQKSKIFTKMLTIIINNIIFLTISFSIILNVLNIYILFYF